MPSVFKAKMGFIALTLFSALLSLPVQATENINTQYLKKTIVYIYRGDNEGHPDPNLILGTGFLVQVPLVSNPNLGFLVLVTARHMVDPAWGHCPDSPPRVIYLRYNKKVYDPVKGEAGIDYLQVPLSVNDVLVWSHPVENDSDVAVVPLDSQEMKVIKGDSDAEGISISDFATDEEAKQRTTTDPVLSVGLIPNYPGVKRNYPFWKFGQISDKPDESVMVPCFPEGGTTAMRVWFLSINLVQGNSGSPIFYAPEGANGVSFGGGRPFLLGLQSISFLGADISGMTPVHYIFETIQNLKLQDADLYRGLPLNRLK